MVIITKEVYIKMTQQKKLFKLSYPIFLESLLFSIIGSVDTLMLSGFDDNAVGAVGVVNQILFLVLIAGNIIVAGSGILLAQYIGAKRPKEDVQNLTLSALMVNLFLGGVFSLVLVLFQPWILGLMNIEGDMLLFAKDYFLIISRFLFLHLLTMTFSMYLRSHGLTKTTLIVSVILNLLNVILNYVLIYGHLGFPSLGVQGAAYATVISRTVGLGILLYLVYQKGFKNHPITFTPKVLQHHLPKIFYYGAPAAGEQISYNLAKFVMMIFITRLGPQAITAYAYSNTLVSFVYIFAVSLGQGTAILVGWHVGAKEHEKAHALGLSAAKLSFLVSMFFCTLLVVFRVPLLTLLTKNEDIIALASTVLLFNFLVEAGRSQNLIFVNALRASGDVHFPFYISILSMWGMGVGFAFLFTFPLALGLPGIWIALGLDEVFRALVLRHRWHKRHGGLSSPFPTTS